MRAFRMDNFQKEILFFSKNTYHAVPKSRCIGTKNSIKSIRFVKFSFLDSFSNVLFTSKRKRDEKKRVASNRFD